MLTEYIFGVRIEFVAVLNIPTSLPIFRVFQPTARANDEITLLTTISKSGIAAPVDRRVCVYVKLGLLLFTL